MISTSKQRRLRARKLSAAYTCPRRAYQDEPTARRCLWAMGQQVRIDTSRMMVERCRMCLAWHVGRVK